MNKRSPLLLLIVLSLVCGSFAFTGCLQAVDVPVPFEFSGYWKAAYGDGFEFSGKNFTQYNDSTKSIMFAGTIVNYSDTTESTGFLTIQITDDGVYDSYTVGKYLVVRWKSNTGTALLQSTPYKTGGFNSGMDTPALAQTEQTEANGYYTYWPAYEKQ